MSESWFRVRIMSEWFRKLHGITLWTVKGQFLLACRRHSEHVSHVILWPAFLLISVSFVDGVLPSLLSGSPNLPIDFKIKDNFGLFGPWPTRPLSEKYTEQYSVLKELGAMGTRAQKLGPSCTTFTWFRWHAYQNTATKALWNFKEDASNMVNCLCHFLRLYRTPVICQVTSAVMDVVAH